MAPIDRATLAAGAVLLGFALQMSDGFYQPSALAVVCVAWLAIGAAALRLPSRLGAPAVSERIVHQVMAAGVLLGLACLAVAPIGFYVPDPRPLSHWPVIAGLAIAAMATCAAYSARPRVLPWALGAGVAAHLMVAWWMIDASPNPPIDVLTVHRAALDALWRGSSPYATTFANIYPDASFYAPGLVQDGRVLFGLPYPPLSLLMALPGEVLGGDVRYATSLSLAIGMLLTGMSAPGRTAPLAAMLVLFTPRAFFVIEQGWTEPYAVLWLGAFVWMARGSRAAPRRLSPLPLGLLVAVKQHLVLTLVLLPLACAPAAGPWRWWRTFVMVAAVSLSCTVPFALWDPHGFFRSVVWLQMAEPLRPDSLSVLSYAFHHGWDVSTAVQVVAPLAALALTLVALGRAGVRGPAAIPVGLALLLLALFGFGKKAFCNYYVLVIALAAAGVVAGADDDRRAA